MLQLAVTTNAETYERMQAPLANRNIKVEYVQPDERTLALNAAGEEYEGFDVGFVHPTRLMEGEVIDSLLGVPWVNDCTTVLDSRNKAKVITTLDKADIPVPKTVMISNPVDKSALIDVFEQFSPPVVVKPNSATRGAGVTLAHDLDSFLGLCDYLAIIHGHETTADQSFLVQEYFPEARDYRVMCVDGEYVGAVERRLPADALDAGQWKHNVHRGATATGVDLPSDLRHIAERTADVLDSPWLGIDLLVTEDRTIVNETNARPTIDEETKYEPTFYDSLADLIRKTAPA